jgi:predicted nucleotidyltransferase
MSELSQIKTLIESIKPELTKRYHINRIGLFGSIVKEEIEFDQEVDIIVDFKKPIGEGIMDLTHLLEKKLNHPVSIITKGSIDREYLKEIRSEIVYV